MGLKAHGVCLAFETAFQFWSLAALERHWSCWALCSHNQASLTGDWS